jgi:hypothetical protein
MFMPQYFQAYTRPIPYAKPKTGQASAVASGGTALVAVSGPISGGFITNPALAADQGLGQPEALYADCVNPPGSSPGAGNNTTVALQPGETFVLPPLADGQPCWVNAASSGHLFTIEVW